MSGFSILRLTYSKLQERLFSIVDIYTLISTTSSIFFHIVAQAIVDKKSQIAISLYVFLYFTAGFMNPYFPFIFLFLFACCCFGDFCSAAGWKLSAYTLKNSTGSCGCVPVMAWKANVEI